MVSAYLIEYLHQLRNGAKQMFTQEQAEKFADWIIKQENKMIAARYPISEEEKKELDALSDEELLEKLGVN